MATKLFSAFDVLKENRVFPFVKIDSFFFLNGTKASIAQLSHTTKRLIGKRLLDQQSPSGNRWSIIQLVSVYYSVLLNSHWCFGHHRDAAALAFILAWQALGAEHMVDVLSLQQKRPDSDS